MFLGMLAAVGQSLPVYAISKGRMLLLNCGHSGR